MCKHRLHFYSILATRKEPSPAPLDSVKETVSPTVKPLVPWSMADTTSTCPDPSTATLPPPPVKEMGTEALPTVSKAVEVVTVSVDAMPPVS